MIPFEFNIKQSEDSKRTLIIEPNFGKVEPMSNFEIKIIYQPNTIGVFKEEILLFVRFINYLINY